jgi:hypothetical protein
VFLVWLHRAYSNLPALGSLLSTYTPGWAVGWWFVPFANLVQPHGVMRNLWIESQRRPISDQGFALAPSTPLIGWWWGLFLACRVLTMVSRISATGSWLAFVALLDAVNALLCLLMVRRISERQEAQHQDLALREKMPQPIANALR